MTDSDDTPLPRTGPRSKVRTQRARGAESLASIEAYRLGDRFFEDIEALIAIEEHFKQNMSDSDRKTLLARAMAHAAGRFFAKMTIDADEVIQNTLRDEWLSFEVDAWLAQSKMQGGLKP